MYFKYYSSKKGKTMKCIGNIFNILKLIIGILKNIFLALFIIFFIHLVSLIYINVCNDILLLCTIVFAFLYLLTSMIIRDYKPSKKVLYIFITLSTLLIISQFYITHIKEPNELIKMIISSNKGYFTDGKKGGYIYVIKNDLDLFDYVNTKIRDNTKKYFEDSGFKQIKFKNNVYSCKKIIKGQYYDITFVSNETDNGIVAKYIVIEYEPFLGIEYIQDLF